MSSDETKTILSANRLLRLCEQAKIIESQRNVSPLPLIIGEINEILSNSYVSQGLPIPDKVRSKIKNVNCLAKKRGLRYRVWSV
jgi:hypothetical protein